MPDAFSLYPTPPQANQGAVPNVLANPGQAINLLQGVVGLQKAQQELRARSALGDIYRRNLNPDGTLNEAGYARDVANNPDTSFMGAEAVAGGLQRETQKIQNQGLALDVSNKQLELNQKRAQFAAQYIAGMVDPVKPTKDQVLGLAPGLVRNLGIPSAVANSITQQAITDPQGIKHGVAMLQNYLLGNAATDTTAGPPGEGGQPTNITRATRNVIPGAMATALSPKQQASQSASGTGAGAAVNDARIADLNYTQRVFPLEQAIPALEQLGTTGTGPGKETLNHIKSFVLSNVPGADFSGVKSDVEAFDKAKKYLTDFVNQNGNTGTNDKLAAAFAGNPSVNISNAAATDVAKSALSLQRMRHAMQVWFDTSGKSDEEFPKEAAAWMRNHDSRVYGFDMMTPKQRNDVLNSLPKGKRELFMLDVQDALQNGIIKPPQ